MRKFITYYEEIETLFTLFNLYSITFSCFIKLKFSMIFLNYI